MDEIDLLKRVGGEPRDDELAERRARATLSARIEQDSPSERSPTRRPLRWRIAAPAVAAAVAVGLLAVPVIVGNGTGGAQFASAADALNSTAVVAASQPSEPPHAGQYLYTKTEGLDLSIMLGPSPDEANVLIAKTMDSTPSTTESWLGLDGSGERRGTSDGHPYYHTYPAGELSWQDTSGLPTDPAALLKVFESGDLGGGTHPSGERLFNTVEDTLLGGYVSPELRSAIYQVLANLPDVELVGTVADHVGREGTEVTFTHPGGMRDGLIFDPSTSQVLETNVTLVEPQPGTQVRGAIPGPGPGEQTVAYTVYEESGVVDSIGALP
jgi:hypothetical protein